MEYHILVIEDDQSIRENLVDLLEEEGYAVDSFSNVETVLESIGQTVYDVILCDIMLPGKNGYEFLSIIRNSIEPKLKPAFIFITAKLERSDLRKGMELGADDFITKPFKLAEIRKAIRTQIDKRIEIRSNVSQLANTKITGTEYSDLLKEKVSNRLNYTGSIFLDTNQNTRMLKLKEILYIKANGDYTFVHSFDNKQYNIRKTVISWIDTLPKEQFIQIHRGIIINIEYIQKIEKWFNYSYRVYLHYVSEPFVISQRFSRALRNTLKDFKT